MPLRSETTPPSQIHHRFTSDLLEVYPAETKHTFQDLRMFRVLSDVLSDRKIKSGEVIEMRSLDPGQDSRTLLDCGRVLHLERGASPAAVRAAENAHHKQRQKKPSKFVSRSVLEGSGLLALGFR